MKDSETLINHHVKYKEIHGEDEVIIMTKEKHRALHRKLRKEDKCNIPVEDLRKISNKAYNRKTKVSKSLFSFSPEKYSRIQVTLKHNRNTDHNTINTLCYSNTGMRCF